MSNECLLSTMGSSFYLTSIVDHFSTFFQLAMNRGPFVVVDCIVINVRFYSPYIKKALEI